MLKKNLNQDIIERKNMKRSVTPLIMPGQQASGVSILESNKMVGSRPQGGLNDLMDEKRPRIGNLRIVKSIHHSQARDSKASVVIEETSDIGVVSNSGFSPKLNEPINSFISHQEKRNFVPDPSQLILQGKQKPKQSRSRKKYAYVQKQRTNARDSGCQTSPKSSMKLITQKSEEKFEEDDSPSTQKNSSREKLQDVKQGTQTYWNRTHIQVNIPNKILFRGNSGQSISKKNLVSSTDGSMPVISQQTQRNFKISLLKTNQAHAKNKYFLPPNYTDLASEKQPASSTRQGHRYSKRESQTGASISQAFQTSQQFAPSTTQHKMHTAMLTSKRQTRTRERFLSYREQDMRQDIFSWNNQSLVSPNSDNENNQTNKDHVNQAIHKANMRTRASVMHVTGAFQDHSIKPSMDADQSRNFLRSQLNKTQQFFMQASRSPEIIETGEKFLGDVAVETELHKSEIEDVIGKEKVNKIRVKVKESIEAIDDSMMASLKPLPLNETNVDAAEEVPDMEESNRESNAQRINNQESIVSFLDKKHGSDKVLKDDANMTEQYLDEDSIKFDHKITNKTSCQPSVAMDEALDMIEQYQRGATTTQCSSIAAFQYPSKMSSQMIHLQQQLNANQAPQWPSKQKIKMIEARLIKQMQGELEKKEYQIYGRYGLESQKSYNVTEAHLFDLLEHPEWNDATRELQDIYFSIFETFNDQLIAQNYFIRTETAGSHQTFQMSATGKQQNLTNQRSEFIEYFVSRIQNLLKQQNRLQTESTKQLNHLKEENARLNEEITKLRQSDNKIKDSQTIIKEMINKYFQMGNDRDLKSKRVKEAEEFLKTKPLSEIMNDEQYQTITRLDYSNVLSRLEQVVIAMQMPSISYMGNRFDIADHKFDSDFIDNIKQLFSNPIKSAQYDAAMQALTMVYKDTQFADAEIQASEAGIDHDLLEQIKFLKGDILRLQSEINGMKNKMAANEKAMKTATREKNDAVLSSKVFEQSLMDSKQNEVRTQNMTAQYKLMHTKAQTENEQLFVQVSKLGAQVEKFKKNDKLAEKALDKMQQLNGRKDVLIRDLDGLVEMLECLASEEQAKKIRHVRNLKQKIEVKNQELKQLVWEFQRRDHVQIKPSRQSVLRTQQNQSQMSGFGNVDGAAKEPKDEEMLEYERNKNMAEADQVRKPASKRQQRARKQKGQEASEEQSPTNSHRANSNEKQDSPGQPRFKKTNSDANGNAEGMFKRQLSESSSGVDLSEEEIKESNTNILILKRTTDNKHLKEIELTSRDLSEESLKDIKESGESMSLSSHDSEVEVKVIQSPTFLRKQNLKDFDKVSPNSPTGMSNQTEGLNSDRYDEEAHMKIKGFNNRDIIVNSQQQWNKPLVHDQGMQTDTEMFFKYIFDFLAELERRINSGEISIDDILAMGRMALGQQQSEDQAAGSKTWGYKSPGKQEQSFMFSVQELKECLRRLKSLSSHGGDLFFAGIAKTMVTKPIIPTSYNPTLAYHRVEDQGNSMMGSSAKRSAMARLEMQKLQKMTRVSHSTGGGSGAAKNPSSPTKAQKASIAIGSASPIFPGK